MTALATPNTTDESNVASLDAPSRSLWADAWIRLRRNKAAVVGMFIIGFFVIVALFAPLIAPHNPLQIHDGMSYLPPAWVDESSTGRHRQAHRLRESGYPDFRTMPVQEEP